MYFNWCSNLQVADVCVLYLLCNSATKSLICKVVTSEIIELRLALRSVSVLVDLPCSRGGIFGDVWQIQLLFCCCSSCVFLLCLGTVMNHLQNIEPVSSLAQNHLLLCYPATCTISCTVQLCKIW